MGTYYVGRVLKLGTLDQEKLIEAINNPTSISSRGNAWTFTDVKEYKSEESHYIFGHLCKYQPKGEVTVLDTEKRSGVTQIEPNLMVAGSPFLYIPEHSGIVFLNVYRHIEQKTFAARFAEIIEETHKGFFVECKIEMVSDLRTFAIKLLSLDGIYKIQAKVSPPNPLFGPLWEPLKSYLEARNTDKLSIIEDAPKSEPINTHLPIHVQKSSEQTEEELYVPEEELPIGDAAILMAADGYGHGTVRGKKGKESVVIKTAETVKNFVFENGPDPTLLFEKAYKIFQSIKNKRHMKH